MSDEFQNQLHAGNVLDEDVEPEEILKNAPEAQIARWLEIFFQMNKSRRFRDFVNKNFVIQDEVDPDARTIMTLVIENPISVGPLLAPQQIVGIGKLLAQNGVTDLAKVMQGFMEILGQEEDMGVTLDTDVKQAVEDAKTLSLVES